MAEKDKNYRSMLFVPGDSERKIEKSFGVGSDALIFDLEDAVMPVRREDARALVRATLDATQNPSAGARSEALHRRAGSEIEAALLSRLDDRRRQGMLAAAFQRGEDPQKRVLRGHGVL